MKNSLYTQTEIHLLIYLFINFAAKKLYNNNATGTSTQQPRTQAQKTKSRHTTVFLYRSVAKLGECAGSTHRKPIIH